MIFHARGARMTIPSKHRVQNMTCKKGEFSGKEGGGLKCWSFRMLPRLLEAECARFVVQAPSFGHARPPPRFFSPLLASIRRPGSSVTPSHSGRTCTLARARALVGGWDWEPPHRRLAKPSRALSRCELANLSALCERSAEKSRAVDQAGTGRAASRLHGRFGPKCRRWRQTARWRTRRPAQARLSTRTRC
eukprot:364429-Chlamydomonas_euryale.AAC.11